MPKLTLLAQIKNMLLDQFNKVYNGSQSEKRVKISILQNSGEVAKELYEDEDEIHIQLTKVEPYFSPEDLESDERKTNAQKAFAIDEFIYETPFTTASTKERHSSSVSDQWKLQTILTTEHKFPYLATRLRVKSRREIRLTPIQVAIEAMKTRTERLRSAVAMNDPKMIQIILQGSCLPTVNGGPMELCRAFLPALPVIYEDDAGTSTGELDEVDEDEDTFLEEDEDSDNEGECKKGRTLSIGPPPTAPPPLPPIGPPTVPPPNDNVPLDGSDKKSTPEPDADDEEKKKAAAIAEEMKPTPEQIQNLRENVRDFLKACGMALKVNKFMSSDHDMFHRELSNGYEKLCDELYPLVGAIPGAAGVMGSQRALMTAKPHSMATPTTPSRADVCVNGSLIPSLRRERRKSRRGAGGSLGGSSALGHGGTSENSTGSGRVKIPKSETFATISLSLARKRADESLDGDPNSISSVGVQTPASARVRRGSNNPRLNVVSPACNSTNASTSTTPVCANSPCASSASAVSGANTFSTPLKVRAPLPNDDDTSSMSSSDSGTDEDIPAPESSDGSRQSSSSRKGKHHKGRSHHHHKKESEQ